MAKIELPECWAGVAEPLRALMAEAAPPDLQQGLGMAEVLS